MQRCLWDWTQRVRGSTLSRLSPDLVLQLRALAPSRVDLHTPSLPISSRPVLLLLEASEVTGVPVRSVNTGLRLCPGSALHDRRMLGLSPPHLALALVLCAQSEAQGQPLTEWESGLLESGGF